VESKKQIDIEEQDAKKIESDLFDEKKIRI